MKKIYILLTIFAFCGLLSVANLAKADEVVTTGTTSTVETSTTTAEVTYADLGVDEPTLLPNSKFYFLKKWGRGIERMFTFNSIKKADLELKIANKQVAEIKKLKETDSENVESIQRAIENYQSNIDRFKAKLESLKETSQNPNIDKLLDKLTDRSLRHEQLFENLKKKFEDKEALKSKIEEAKKDIDEKMQNISEKIETKEKYKERLEKKIEELKSDDEDKDETEDEENDKVE